MSVEVSIIIVNYNTYDLTCQCIESIGHCTEQTEYEIILVDNGSDEEIQTPFANRFPEIIFIRSEKNVGFAAGNNLGIAKAQGEFLLLLNSDTMLIKGQDAISFCKNYMMGDSQVGVVSCRLEYPDGNYQSNAQRFPGFRYKLYELLRLQKLMSSRNRGRTMLGAFFDHGEEVEVDWVWGTFFFTRRKIVQELENQKLNDDYFMYGEDIQWCLDIRKLGYKIMFLPECTVIHLMGGSNPDKAGLMRSSYDLFLNKNYSAVHRLLIRSIDKLLVWK